MKGRKVSFNDEVSSSSAKTQEIGTEAKERFATGTNSTKRHTSKSKPHGKLGGKGQPD